MTASYRSPHSSQIDNDWATSSYYSKAEDVQWMNAFWGADSKFLPLFKRLDLAQTAELACGHGRHANRVLREFDVGSILLIDVNETNIAHCKDRFKDEGKVRYAINKGNDIPVDEAALTSLFCYDAMVHFELFDIIGYLQEIARVLKPGGRALLHHSNYTGRPGGNYHDNPHWRNFMSAALFSHIAERAGLLVLRQTIIPWGGTPELDCLTLIEK